MKSFPHQLNRDQEQLSGIIERKLSLKKNKGVGRISIGKWKGGAFEAEGR